MQCTCTGSSYHCSCITRKSRRKKNNVYPLLLFVALPTFINLNETPIPLLTDARSLLLVELLGTWRSWQWFFQLGQPYANAWGSVYGFQMFIQAVVRDWGVGRIDSKTQKGGWNSRGVCAYWSQSVNQLTSILVPAMPRSVGNIQIGSLLCFPAFLNYLMSISFS